jgi:transposase
MALYVRKLTQGEQAQANGLTFSSDAVTYRRARIVLMSAHGWRVQRIMAALGLSDRTVRDVIHGFNEGGLASLPRRKAPGAKRICDQGKRGALVEISQHPPTDYGIPSKLWTAEDLAAVAVRLGLVERISGQTVRREMRRSGKTWQRTKRWTSPDPDYAKKGGSSSV